MTTESLCANPVEIYLLGLGQVWCAYMPGESVLILSLNSVPHEDLSLYSGLTRRNRQADHQQKHEQKLL